MLSNAIVETMTLELAIQRIQHHILETGFEHSSSLTTGALLSALVASKPQGLFLELGTGLGMGTAHIWAGLDQDSYFITVDTHKTYSLKVQDIIQDPKVEFRIENGIHTLEEMPKKSFDLIFADASIGKMVHFEQTWALLKVGGIYFIDDVLPQAYWSAAYTAHFTAWLHTLKQRPDVVYSQLDVGSGIVLATKR